MSDSSYRWRCGSALLFGISPMNCVSSAEPCRFGRRASGRSARPSPAARPDPCAPCAPGAKSRSSRSAPPATRALRWSGQPRRTRGWAVLPGLRDAEGLAGFRVSAHHGLHRESPARDVELARAFDDEQRDVALAEGDRRTLARCEVEVKLRLVPGAVGGVDHARPGHGAAAPDRPHRRRSRRSSRRRSAPCRRAGARPARSPGSPGFARRRCRSARPANYGCRRNAACRALRLQPQKRTSSSSLAS